MTFAQAVIACEPHRAARDLFGRRDADHAHRQLTVRSSWCSAMGRRVIVDKNVDAGALLRVSGLGDDDPDSENVLMVWRYS
jgi:hypothetical protein